MNFQICVLFSEKGSKNFINRIYDKVVQAHRNSLLE